MPRLREDGNNLDGPTVGAGWIYSLVLLKEHGCSYEEERRINREHGH